MHLIQKFVVLKGDSNPKHFSFFVFDFNVSNKKNFPTPYIIPFLVGIQDCNRL